MSLSYVVRVLISFFGLGNQFHHSVSLSYVVRVLISFFGLGNQLHHWTEFFSYLLLGGRFQHGSLVGPLVGSGRSARLQTCWVETWDMREPAQEAEKNRDVLKIPCQVVKYLKGQVLREWLASLVIAH